MASKTPAHEIVDQPFDTALSDRYLVYALSTITAQRPDLLIADVDMPRLDGMQLCQAIRQDPELAALPILLVTAYLRPSDPQLEAAGATMVLRKPFGVEELAEAVQRCLDVRGADARPAETESSSTDPASTANAAAGLLAMATVTATAVDASPASCPRAPRS